MSGDKWTKDLTGVDVADHSARHEDGGADEISLTGLAGTEIRLIPKASSTGGEGTIFYDSDDDSVYVATEA